MGKEFKKIPVKDIIKVPDKGQFIEIYRNRWWVVTSDDCILNYKEISYQCNMYESIIKKTCESYKTMFVGCKPVFIEIAFLPHNCRDYV